MKSGFTIYDNVVRLKTVTKSEDGDDGILNSVNVWIGNSDEAAESFAGFI